MFIVPKRKGKEQGTHVPLTLEARRSPPPSLFASGAIGKGRGGEESGNKFNSALLSPFGVRFLLPFCIWKRGSELSGLNE